MLTEPDLHDGNINMVSIVGRTELAVGATHLDGYNVVLKVKDLIDLRINDFREGNTVADVTVYSGSDCPTRLLDFICYGDKDWIDKKRRVLEDGGGRLLAITCSYGCTLVAHFGGELKIESVK
jgi:hypothetical protein